MSTEHFEPGPVEFAQQLDQNTTATRDLIAALIRAESVKAKELPFEIPGGGQTDPTGFLQTVLYECPQGFAFSVHRINLNAVNPATGKVYTPAAPYAAGWVGFFRGEPGAGNMFDFAPPSPGSNVFPQISTDGKDSAAIIRGERIILQVTGGPVSTQVLVTLVGGLVVL